MCCSSSFQTSLLLDTTLPSIAFTKCTGSRGRFGPSGHRPRCPPYGPLCIGGRPRVYPGPPTRPLVAGGHGNADAFLLEQFANMLEPLVLAQGDRATVGFALRFPRRILQVGLHECLDCVPDGYQNPCALGVVVHEDVVTLLRILPEVEDLRHGGHVLLLALPAQVRVHGEGARRLAVVAAQIEYRLVVAHPGRAGRELVLREVEPARARRLAGSEEHGGHV